MSPVASIVFFVVTTLMYAVSRKTPTGDGKESLRRVLAYFFFTLISQYIFNLTASVSICGAPQYFNTVMITLFPWILIFGLTIIFINLNPTWTAPFSNSIGYMIILAAGLKRVMNSILIPLNSNMGEVSGDFAEALTYIYGNQSLLVNQITPSNFKNFWDMFKESGLAKRDMPNDAEGKLLSLVETKETCGVVTWYLLTGILAAVVSYNYIISSQCDLSSEELKRRHQEYSQVLAAKLDESKKPTRIYTTVE